MMPRIARLLVPVAAMIVAAACGPLGPPAPIRLNAETMSFAVSFDPTPPYAREKTRYKVVVRDRDSGAPIENGEGRVYASNIDQKGTYDALVPGTELGTYYANLNFLTAGNWAVAVQFRRDSTKPLEKVEWHQDIRASRTPDY